MRALGLTLLLCASSAALALPTNKFHWPVAATSGKVCAYRDSGGVKDWKCNGNTYANHKGTDIAVGSGTTVLAAANGVVKHRVDGCPVGSLGSTCGAGGGNQVLVWHADSTSVNYHLLSGSGLAAVGKTVTCGERLGLSGSSGNSSGPHLHFQTNVGGTQAEPYSGTPDDPFTGPCSGPVSYWVSQGTGYVASCGAISSNPKAANTCGCPVGVFVIWTCNSGLTARERCAGGSVETQQCPYGCQSNATGTDDTCKPAPACPAGTFAMWTCAADGKSRQRCIAGKVETQACAYGCQTNAGADDACKAAPPMCPTGLGAAWTCSADGATRQRCVAGKVETEPCASGCERPDAGDAVCRSAPSCPAGTSSSWTCQGNGRTRCISGTTETQACAEGCEQPESGDAVCKGANPPVPCPVGSYPRFTCEADGSALVRCEAGVTSRVACEHGCVPGTPEEDDACAAAPAADPGDAEPPAVSGCGCGSVDGALLGVLALLIAARRRASSCVSR